MYNPHHLYHCEVEKRKKSRGLIDVAMTAIGGVASVSSLPQIIKIWETGNVAGISLATYLIALLAVCAWFLYGLYIRNKPLAITSGVSALVLGTVVVQIIIFS